jgi:hypothetical protein
MDIEVANDVGYEIEKYTPLSTIRTNKNKQHINH